MIRMSLELSDRTILIREPLDNVEKGILWIYGKPGVVKSYYVEELIQKYNDAIVYTLWTGSQDERYCFTETTGFLGEASIIIRQKYESQGGASLPLNVRALFLHPFSLIESEQAFVSRLIHELLEGASRHGQIY